MLVEVNEWKFIGSKVEVKMEQLAHFVTKSFEYNNNNNNRVLDVLNLTTKSTNIFDQLKSTDSIDTLSDVDSDNNDGDSVDIDITDVSSNDGNDTNIHNENDNNNLNVMRQCTPVKKMSKENQRQITRNWLISDTPKRKCENGAFFCSKIVGKITDIEYADGVQEQSFESIKRINGNELWNIIIKQ